MATTQDLIDRMVDGGMTPAELRQAIAQLDAAPENWRCCALAFLEAQSWADVFRSLDESAGGMPLEAYGGEPSNSTAGLKPLPLTPATTRRWNLRAAALAATIAGVAFALGWASRSARGPGGIQRSVPAVLAGDLRTSPPPIEAVNERAAGPQPLAPGAIAGLPVDRVPTVREVARLRFASGSDGAAEIPIFAGPGVNPQWLLDQPPPVSDHDRAVWQRHGYELDQQRRLLSVPLKNGRRATVPIDQVQVRYVGQVAL